MTTTVVQFTIGYSGAAQNFGLPSNYVPASLFIECVGAGGSNNHQAGAYAVGGGGGYNAGYFPPTLVGPGDTLFVYVGGRGGDYNNPGYNGGGAGGVSTGSGGYKGWSGGGATDVRVGGNAVSNRVLVAGGGGGAGGGYYNSNGYGGSGGTPSGTTGGNPSVDTAYGHGGGGGAGGAGGAGYYPASSGIAGSLAYGGRGSNHTTAGYSSGGGGGGGWYGGGGGGGSTGNSNAAGGGGGGSGHFSAYLTNTINYSGYNPAETDGYVTVTYQTNDPPPPPPPPPPPSVFYSNAAFAAQGGMAFTPNNTITPGLAFGTTASIQATGIGSTSLLIGNLPLTVTGSLSVTQSPSARFGLAPLASSGSLSVDGFRNTSSALNLSAFGALLTQINLGSLSMTAIGSLINTSAAATILGGVPMSSRAGLVLRGLDTIQCGLVVSPTSRMAFLPRSALWGSLTMAANGAVRQSAALSDLGGLLMHPRASLALSALLVTAGTTPMFLASATLLQPSAEHHPYTLLLGALAALAVTPTTTPIAAPFFQGLAALALTDTAVSNVMLLNALANLTLEDDPAAVLDPPYLVITDANNTVSFFITNRQNGAEWTSQ